MCPEHDGNGNESTEDREREWTYNIDNSTVDMMNLRPTDMPFNINVFLLKPLETDTEIKIMELKRKLLDTTREYIDHNKKEKVQMYPNLTTSEGKGLKR